MQSIYYQFNLYNIILSQKIILKLKKLKRDKKYLKNSKKTNTQKIQSNCRYNCPEIQYM